MDLSRLVFIDESGAKTNMTRLYGRAMAGQRAIDDTPSGHWCTTTMISSVRLDGSTACMVVDGATTKDIFEAYIEQILLPTIKAGDIVVLDNLSAYSRVDRICRSQTMVFTGILTGFKSDRKDVEQDKIHPANTQSQNRKNSDKCNCPIA
jgi:hypothetical protein